MKGEALIQKQIQPSEPDKIVDVVEKLNSVATMVRTLSFRITMLTLFNILTPAALYFLKRANALTMISALLMALLLSAIWCFTLAQLYDFEQTRKIGEGLHQDIADEAEWFTKEKERRDFYPFELRQSIKQFTINAQLPLFMPRSGRLGAVAYGVWNSAVDLGGIGLALYWMQ